MSLDIPLATTHVYVGCLLDIMTIYMQDPSREPTRGPQDTSQTEINSLWCSSTEHLELFFRMDASAASLLNL